MDEKKLQDLAKRMVEVLTPEECTELLDFILEDETTPSCSWFEAVLVALLGEKRV